MQGETSWVAPRARLGKALAATAGIVALALVVAASASATLDKSFTPRVASAAAVAGDCNDNRVPDTSEPAWVNRDDDGDGICNGVDGCPAEASPATCEMQAITVPWRPGAPNAPHPTYSGATTTLKGIARYGGNQYRWDFGDGSPSMGWTPIGDPYNLGVQHVYTGEVGRLFFATLSVRNLAAPAVVSTATYPLRIESSTAGLPADRAQLDVRAQMAIDNGLWYLHVNQTRGLYGDGAPGYLQPYGFWANTPIHGTCAALDAFEEHGSSVENGWRTDPYSEDARRALAYVLANGAAAAISQQQYGGQLVNPDTNGNGLGLWFGSSGTYESSVCALALADSGAPTRQAPTGGASIYGRPLAAVVQDAVDWFAFSQNDGSGFARGGWGYTANDQYSIGETFRWPIIAMGAAERRMGATVPAFVRQNIPYFLNYSHYTNHDSYNGGWGWQSPNQWPSAGFTAAGMIAHAFIGDSSAHADVKAAQGFLYRHWADVPADGIFGNLGDSDAAYTVMLAMQGASPDPLSSVHDYDYLTATALPNAFDWYYTPPGQTQQGHASNLVLRQRADGAWDDTVPSAGAHGAGTVWSTAWDTIVLGKGDTARAPVADPGGPYSGNVNQSLLLDASSSFGDDGEALTYAWDLTAFDNTGAPTAFADGTGATATFSRAAYGTYPVCVRVAGSDGSSSSACTTVTIKPPPHTPTAKLAPSYSGVVNVPVHFDASSSYDVDNDPLTYAWDLHGNGMYTDASGVAPTMTYSLPGSYVACVRVTDDPAHNAVPYSAPASSAIACAPVVIGAAPANQPPTASIANPVRTVTGPVPTTVTLDASGSSDPDGDPLTYAWTFDAPGGATSGAGTSQLTLTYTSYGTFQAHVTVSDGLHQATANATVTVVDPAPAVPTGVSATASPGSITVTWSPSDGATSYAVSRSSDGVSYAPLGSVGSTSYTDATVAPGQTYSYEVAAVNGVATSAPSAPASATTPLAAPAGVTAVLSGAAVTVGWTASPGATSYAVLRSADGGVTYGPLQTVAATTLTDSSVARGHAYTYVVVAQSAATSSPQSAAASIAVPPAVPTGLSAAASGADVSLSWEPADGAVGYELFRSGDGGATYASIGAPSSTSYLDGGLTAGSTYLYVVRALSADAASDRSGPVTVTLAPARPSGLTASYGGGAVTLAWSPSAGATSYSVERSPDGVTFAPVGTTPASSFIDASVSPGQAYVYVVVAHSAAASSAPSDPASVTIPLPAPSLTAPLDGQTVVGSSVGVAGAAAPGATVTVLEAGSPVGTFTADAAGAYGGAVTLPYGLRTLEAVQRLGGVESAASAPVTIAVVPAAPSIAAPAVVVGAAAEVTGLAEPGASVQVLDGLDSVASVVADSTGAYHASVALHYGPNELRAQQTVAGQTSALSPPVTVHAVPAPPTFTSTAAGQPAVASPVPVWGAGIPGADVTVLDGGTPAAVLHVGADGAYAGAVPLAGGTHTLTARQVIAGETSASSAPVSVSVDATPPVVTYTGNAGTYSVGDTVAIHCTATDAGSGLASSTCADITGPAYTFGLGAHTFSARATDNAGNTATATVTFTVVVDTAGLCALTKQLVQGSAKYQALHGAADGLANGACKKLEAITLKGNAAAKAALVNAYDAGLTGLVSAGWLTAAQAATLRSLADRL